MLIKKIGSSIICLKEEVTSFLKEVSDQNITKEFKKINNLINSNKPVEAIKCSRLILLQLLKHVQSSNLKKWFIRKYSLPIALLDLIQLWENRIKYSLEKNEVTLTLAENYFISVFYIYKLFNYKLGVYDCLKPAVNM